MDRIDKNQREMRIITVVALCVAVICLSVAYAAMGQTLTITGSAEMRMANWNIHIDNLKATTTGLATYTMPNVSNTQLGNYDVVLNKPGDSVTFTFDIVNDGDINATLGTLTKGKPKCSSLTNKKDEEIVCNNIVYSLKYADGSSVEVGDSLLVNNHMSAKLTISYDESATEVPESTVNISDLDLTLIYDQQ